MKARYYQLRSRSYRLLRLKLALVALVGLQQRSDFAYVHRYHPKGPRWVWEVYVRRRG